MGEIVRNEMTDDFAVIMSFLAGNPTPEQILALQPSPKLQTRASALLAQNKTGILSEREELELDRILQLDHLVRMEKAKVIQQQAGK